MRSRYHDETALAPGWPSGFPFLAGERTAVSSVIEHVREAAQPMKLIPKLKP